MEILLLKRSVLKVGFNTGDGLFIPKGEKDKHKGKAITRVMKMKFIEDFAEK